MRTLTTISAVALNLRRLHVEVRHKDIMVTVFNGCFTRTLKHVNEDCQLITLKIIVQRVSKNVTALILNNFNNIEPNSIIFCT